MRAFLAKFVPPLSPANVEEIAIEHDRLVAIELKKQKIAFKTLSEKKGK